MRCGVIGFSAAVWPFRTRIIGLFCLGILRSLHGRGFVRPLFVLTFWTDSEACLRLILFLCSKAGALSSSIIAWGLSLFP